MSTCLAVVAAALAIGAAVAPSALARPALPLGHAGRWITDAHGRVVVLHGFNMVYKRPPYYPAAIGFGDDDAAFLAAEGFNTIRLGVIYKAVEPSPGVYDDAYLAQIAHTVHTLGRHGIVSLLDFHQDLYNERFQGEGWPDWAVQDDGLPAQPQQGFPANYLVMPALQRAFDHFWNNDPGPGGVGLQDRFAAAWRHVAARFHADPDVLGYDLLNEPFPGTPWSTCASTVGCPAFDAVMTAFIRRTIAAIRQADPRGLAWYEPNVIFDFGGATNVGDVGDSRAGFTFHDYCLSAGSTGSDNPDCDSFDDMVFANAERHAAQHGDALLLSEFGATDNTTILGKMTARADREMVPWQEWHYCPCADPTTTGAGDKQAIVLDPAQPPSGANLKVSTLDVLSRPYPQVVAGTPESWRFDPSTRRFDLRFATARAGGGALPAGTETEVAVPPRRYGGGYDVELQGAAVRSAPGDRVLRLTACPGAGEVSVTVTPGSGRVRETCEPPLPVSLLGSHRARLRFTVRPRGAVAGRRVRFVFRVTVRSGGRLRAVRGARVRFVGRSRVTDRRGRATIVRRFGRTRRTRFYAARVSRPGLLGNRLTVRVRGR